MGARLGQGEASCRVTEHLLLSPAHHPQAVLRGSHLAQGGGMSTIGPRFGMAFILTP